LESFRLPPSPLSPLQRRLILITTAVAAATRVYALARSPWDWDEVQFCAGVREFEVGLHHPHPPGFPLYILAAKIVRLFGVSDFHALQSVTLLAACTLFPVVFLLARELRFSFRTSYLAALLFVFLPNIWYFGATVFSDITGTALTLAAAAFVLRGCHNTRAVSIGAALVGAALSVRVHAGLILAVPLLMLVWCQRRSWRRIAAVALIAGTIAGVSYLGAALASSSIETYLSASRGLKDWVRNVDSFMNPGRLPMNTIIDDVFLMPMGAGRLSMILAALAALAVLLAIARPHLGVWITFAMFFPYMVFTWFMLDPVGFHRYSTIYVAIYALLGAYTLERITALLGRAGPPAHVAAILVIAGRYGWWVAPAIHVVRSSDSPTYAASQWVLTNVPAQAQIWIDGSMRPWADYFLHDRKVRFVESVRDIDGNAEDYLLDEGMAFAEGAVQFARPHFRVSEIHPRRHFEVAVIPVSSIWRFGDGWYDQESDGTVTWRWMARRSTTLLPPVQGDALLAMTLQSPVEFPPEAEVRLNGELVERFRVPRGGVKKQWRVRARADGANVLSIATSSTINLKAQGLSTDPRDLGLHVSEYRWKAAGSAVTLERRAVR
jgi:hypothetical protein